MNIFMCVIVKTIIITVYNRALIKIKKIKWVNNINQGTWIVYNII